MNDEDFVMGYAVGFNDVKIVEKTITKNGTYRAADDGADGFDPVIVNVDGMSQEDINDLMDWLIDQIMPQLPDGTPEPVLPEIVVGDLRPTVEGYDKPYLTAVSPDGRTTQIMYGIVEQTEHGPNKVYYVDTFEDGVLARHGKALTVQGYGQIPGNTAQLNSDGTVTVTARWEDGTSKTKVWGPFITDSGNTVWSI